MFGLKGPCLGTRCTSAARLAHTRFFARGLHPDPRQGGLLLEETAPAGPLIRAWESRSGQAVHGEHWAPADRPPVPPPPSPLPAEGLWRLDDPDASAEEEEPGDGWEGGGIPPPQLSASP